MNKVEFRVPKQISNKRIVKLIKDCTRYEIENRLTSKQINSALLDILFNLITKHKNNFHNFIFGLVKNPKKRFIILTKMQEYMRILKHNIEISLKKRLFEQKNKMLRKERTLKEPFKKKDSEIPVLPIESNIPFSNIKDDTTCSNSSKAIRSYNEFSKKVEDLYIEFDMFRQQTNDNNETDVKNIEISHNKEWTANDESSPKSAEEQTCSTQSTLATVTGNVEDKNGKIKKLNKNEKMRKLKEFLVKILILKESIFGSPIFSYKNSTFGNDSKFDVINLLSKRIRDDVIFLENLIKNETIMVKYESKFTTFAKLFHNGKSERNCKIPPADYGQIKN